MTQSVDVVVIGAGISGLACGHFLKRRKKRVVVFEAGDRAGGVIETRHDSGFLYEIGPNSTLDAKPGLDRLIDELHLVDNLRYASSKAKNRFILRDGVLHALPMSPPSILKTKLFSARGKLRIAGELFVRARTDDDDESVADFVRRRFGGEFVDYAIGPFVSGVYAGDPDRLSLRSAFPPMYEFEREHGGVIKGAMKTAKKRKAQKAARGKTGPSQLVSFDRGMAAMTDRLAERLRDELKFRSPVSAIRDMGGHGWEVEVESADGTDTIRAGSVVLSTPAEISANLVEGLHAEAAALLRDIPYAPVASVFLGFERGKVSHPLDGFGFLVPAVEKRNILGSIFSSSLFDGRAPKGLVALTTFVGGVRRPELVDMDDDAILEVVMEELRAIIGVTGAPSFSHVYKWKRAIPQYSIGHSRVTDALSAMETQYSGLFFCTNYSRGISVGDCIDHAASVAESVV